MRICLALLYLLFPLALGASHLGARERQCPFRSRPPRELRPLICRFPEIRESILHFARLIDESGNGTYSMDGPKARSAVLRTGGLLVDSGHLSEVVDFVLKSAFRKGLLPKTITAENLP